MLLSDDSSKRNVEIWHVSPATISSEVFEIRTILARAVAKGHIFYVFASITCVTTAIIGAASTIISNAIVNTVTRQSMVPGILVTHDHTSLDGAVVEITSRANAPLEELFDFVPSDEVSCVYSKNQWNNTWRGTCSYAMHLAVDLVVYATNSTHYQDEVPLLSNWLPQWATVDPTKQGRSAAGFYIGAAINGTGKWRDMIVTYAFGNSSYNGVTDEYHSSVQFSLVNYLVHDVARDPTLRFIQTAFKSDIHVVDCTFNSLSPALMDQLYAQTGQYANVATNVVDVFRRATLEASVVGRTAIQPTGQEMLRYWQALMSVKDAQCPHPVERPLLVARQMVQIRLSALAGTVGSCLVAIVAAVSSRTIVTRDIRSRSIHLPSSQIDLAVQAAREHLKSSEGPTTTTHSFSQHAAKYATLNDDLTFVVSLGPDGHLTTWIRSAVKQAVAQPPHPYPYLDKSPDTDQF